MAENILQDTESDYASKDLPQIPSMYRSMDEKDLVIIEDEDSHN